MFLKKVSALPVICSQDRGSADRAALASEWAEPERVCVLTASVANLVMYSRGQEGFHTKSMEGFTQLCPGMRPTRTKPGRKHLPLLWQADQISTVFNHKKGRANTVHAGISLTSLHFRFSPLKVWVGKKKLHWVETQKCLGTNHVLGKSFKEFMYFL